MILGAIYAGKLAVQAGQCCMRRLQVWLSAPSTPSGEMQASSTCSTTKKDDENDDERRSGLRWRTSTSSSFGPVQAPSAGSSSSVGPVQALSAGSSNVGPAQALSAGSLSTGPVQAPIAMSFRVSGPVQASSSTTSVSITAESAGPEQAHFAGSGVGPVQAWRSTNAAAGASSSSAGPVQASSSSSADLGPVQALRSTSAAAGGSMSFGPVQASAASSGPEQAFAADVSGLEQALGRCGRNLWACCCWWRH